ncbi:MAG TPA: amino acid adenylation domain-containing protein, partial [Candidatus Sulfotelmatobacter sp.]|nr:amino acid adenylation domain-containing protein [Candidatus Sulfotelmatobacter sp.]
YRQLNEQANQLPHYLRTLGVGPQVPVALYLERSLQMVVAILGVLKAGGAYVPIDLAYPKERLSFMLEDSQAPVLLTQASLRGALPTPTSRVVCLDTEWASISKGSAENPISKVTGENAAYIIYTSGSTGKPKGVLVTHHNVVRLLQQTAHWYKFDANDVWPLFHSYAFDVSVWELWGSLFYGGRLVIVPYLVSRSPRDFYDLLAREKVTVLNQTPSAFRQLIWAETTAETKHELSLRYVICAGEALELQSLRPWFERHGDAQPKVVNMYGITEITVHATYRVIRKTDLTSGVGSVIGVPIPDLQLYLVDEDLKPVPAGVPGEICVGGAGVARGYLNRPELTRQRFLPDPFSTQPGAQLYRSGDLAQYNTQGELEYLGRMDHQVKIRGFRVELGEIESALNRHAAIRESVVIAQDDPAGGKRLIAYIVPVNGAPTVTELREYLVQKVPDYMVPALFVPISSLPLTTNGKVDRRALPAPDGARPELKAAFVAPRDAAEELLGKIWCQVLELDKVGVQDNFFELGGDSIRSITILSQAQQQGLTLSLQQVFQHPTIAGLAACARTAAGQSVGSHKSEPFSLILPEDRAKLPPEAEDAYPITQLQLGMFYHNELNPVSAVFHDVFSYRIHAPFDREKLQLAVTRLASRHPMLRTAFHLAGFSEPIQLVYRKVRVPFTVEDLRELSPERQSQRLVDWIEAEKRNPFDRMVAPLVRFHTQIHSDQAFQFIISFHHACLDGWSLAAVITEIFQEYATFRQQTDSTLPSPRVTYRDFVALEKQAIRSEECRRFWAEKIQDAAAQLLPRWPKALCSGGHEQMRGPELHIAETTLSGLKHLAQTAGVPLKTVLLAAHARVMGVLYGQTDVISALISNGRPEEVDGEKLIGLFLNALPLRLQLMGGSWLDLVKEAFAAEQEIIPHRRFPLAEIHKLNGGRPLFETAFDFVHFHVYRNLQGLRDLDLAEGHYFEANNLTTYTTFMLDATSSQLELHIDYDPNVLCRQQIEEMSAYYVATLEAMTADPNGRYETFSPLSAAEKQQQLVEWNTTAEEFPRNQCLPQRFEARVQETPDAIALVCQSERLTYRELNARADRLAARLRALNFGAEELVGLCVERSPEMIVALLGILKAGGAYVPLDPTYPKERLAFMLEDAGLRWVLTQEKLVDA